jgi:CelD/BcsL family acetyltransferase involved in cellulose biosynthesis
MLKDIASFASFEADWNRINDSLSGPPFLNSAFIRASLAEFRSGNEKLAVYTNGAEVRAIAIVDRVGFGKWETYQPSQLPIGAIVAEKDLRYADILPSLLTTLPGLNLLLAATQQDPYLHERPVESATIRTVDYIETGWVEVEGAFDAYWAARSKSFRQNTRTQRSKLAAQNLDATLEVLTKPEDVRSAIADYAQLESAGWKGAQGTAIRLDSDQGRFYQSMLEEFCRRGAARIYRYKFGDRVVAVDLCIESPAMQVLLKTTYDESVSALSPSSLMRHDAYRLIFDEGKIKRLEYYGRVYDWTTRWTGLKRRQYHVNVYRWAFLPKIAARLSSWRAASKAKPTVEPTKAS